MRLFSLAAVLALALPVVAQAATCKPAPLAGERVFTVTPDAGAASCIAFGTGNISGNPMDDPIFASLVPGSVLIDKSDGPEGADSDALSSGLTSGLSGSWSFPDLTAPLGFIWTDLVIAFKSGQGQLDPDWGAFLLSSAATSGTWSISGQQELSHVNLYGRLVEAPKIPLPAAGWALLMALGGLGLAARRRAA
jgi:hypothetical protein